MPKYTVQDTQIKHGGADGVILYGPGDVIELTEEEAWALDGSVEKIAEVAEVTSAVQRPRGRPRTSAA